MDVVAGEIPFLADQLSALCVHGEVDLDVVPRDLLAEEKYFLSSLGGSAVVGVVNNLGRYSMLSQHYSPVRL